jgi:hypothetical protein
LHETLIFIVATAKTSGLKLKKISKPGASGKRTVWLSNKPLLYKDCATCTKRKKNKENKVQVKVQQVFQKI